MAQIGSRPFWNVAAELESLSQLKADIHSALGRLLTKCHEHAKQDPPCAAYWAGEAQYWEAQYREAEALVDSMISAVAQRAHMPMRERVGGRTIEINHVDGDVIIANVDGSSNVAVGKDIGQDVKAFPGKHEEDQ